ncbi:hypothetical protein LYZ82_12375 [Xanthomonas hortorum pv. hederae]|nr:hypothetical protein [Xanthomonas hortorum]MCE4371813.1 hypothetical protein [Xanthomonas hortorum pv. hederae]
MLAFLTLQYAHCLLIEWRADRALRLGMRASNPGNLAPQVDTAPLQAQHVLFAPAGGQREQIQRAKVIGQLVVQALGLALGEPPVVLFRFAVFFQANRGDTVEPSPAVCRPQN